MTDGLIIVNELQAPNKKTSFMDVCDDQKGPCLSMS